jgi:hypothetical protein
LPERAAGGAAADAREGNDGEPLEVPRPTEALLHDGDDFL